MRACSAVASLPPPAASPSETMGGGGGDLREVTAVRLLFFFEFLFFFGHRRSKGFDRWKKKKKGRGGARHVQAPSLLLSLSISGERTLSVAPNGGREPHRAWWRLEERDLERTTKARRCRRLRSSSRFSLSRSKTHRATDRARRLFSFLPPSPLTRTQTKKTPPSPEQHRQIHGPEELDATLAAYPDRLVVLMAKSAGCRPCKAFARKYQRVAALYPHAVFTVVTGDESKETRAMMMAMKVGRGEESFVGALA